MTTGTFPLVATLLFLVVALATPVISYLLLRKERSRQPHAFPRTRLRSVFFTGMLLWMAAVGGLGFGMLTLLGFFVYVNAHAGARGDEPMSVLPTLLAAGILGVLVLVGWMLHRHARSRLR